MQAEGPNNGKSQSVTNVRGLVISPAKIRPNATYRVSRELSFVSYQLDPQELRFSLLFWDKLEIPEVLPYVSGGPDEEFLWANRILSRMSFQPPPKFDGDPVSLAQLAVFKFLNYHEPGVWSLGTREGSVVLGDDELENNGGALVTLHQAIPVPDKDVPLQDILEFRQKRRPELLALRTHLEQIYHRVRTAGDGELALNTELGALERGIADHIRASKESRLKFRGVTFSASLNLVRNATAAAAALSAGFPTVTALLAGAAAGISIGSGAGLTWGKPTDTPYSYVSAYHNEVF